MLDILEEKVDSLPNQMDNSGRAGNYENAMKMLDVESTAIRMKNACDSLIDGFLTAKERIIEPKDRSREIT